MDSVFTRLIGSGGYHTAPVSGEAAYNDGFAPVFGMIQLFHGSIKGVKIRMNITVHFSLLQGPFHQIKILG
jgi:hypothetical protein